jgi:uncharacterized membrane protein YgcG
MGDKFMETSPIEVQKALKGMDYPAKKEELIKQAKNNNASKEVMDVLEKLPDKKYGNAVDVSKEFKGEGGERGGRGGSRGGQGSHGGGRGSHQESEGISHRGAGSPPIEAQKALKGMDYPASKEEIVQHAKKHNADEEVMRVLKDIPDRQYENAVDVSKEFKGETKEEEGGRGSHGHAGREGSHGGQGSHSGGRGHNK